MPAVGLLFCGKATAVAACHRHPAKSRLSVYLKGSLVKVQIGLAKGKKLHDKRDAAAARDAKREMDRALKEQQR